MPPPHPCARGRDFRRHNFVLLINNQNRFSQCTTVEFSPLSENHRGTTIAFGYIMMRFNRETGKVEPIDPPRLDLLKDSPYFPHWYQTWRKQNGSAQGSQPLSCQLLPFPQENCKGRSEKKIYPGSFPCTALLCSNTFSMFAYHVCGDTCSPPISSSKMGNPC